MKIDLIKKEKVLSLVKDENFNKYRVFDFPKAIINKHFVERIKDKDFTDFENINWSKTEKPIIKINKPCLPEKLNNKNFKIQDIKKMLFLNGLIKVIEAF